MRTVISLWYFTHHQRWFEAIAAMLAMALLLVACDGGGSGDDFPDDGLPKGRRSPQGEAIAVIRMVSRC